MADTKADLEKQITSLKGQLTKAQNRIAELESAQPSAPTDEPTVVGPNAVPLEQR